MIDAPQSEEDAVVIIQDYRCDQVSAKCSILQDGFERVADEIELAVGYSVRW
jgi:hypothetical protein